jgi:hypothetical protein
LRVRSGALEIQLLQRHAELAAEGADLHEHALHAGNFWRQTDHCDTPAPLQRRQRVRRDAASGAWERLLLFEAVVPAESAFLGTAGVDNDFVDTG